MKTRQMIFLVTFNLLQLIIFECPPSEAGLIHSPSKFRFPPNIVGINETSADKISTFAAQYDDLVDMGLDFLDGIVPTIIRMALVNATLSDDPMTNQITDSHYGLLRLRQAIATLYSPLIGQKLDPEDNVVITEGATEAIFSAFTGHTFPGDEWIVIEPAYSIYMPMIKQAGGVLRTTSLKLTKRHGQPVSKDWELDREELKSLFNYRTKGLLLNNPLNPLGKVYSMEELQFIADLSIKYNTLVITDEAHEWITFKPHIRICSLPGMFERTISVGSSTKTFSVSGWRIGWAYGQKDIMNNLKTVHKTSVYYSPTPQQIALSVGFEDEIRTFGQPDSYFVTHQKYVNRNRELMIQAFVNAGMKPTIPEGASCMFVDWTPLKSRLPNVRTDTDFAMWIISNVGILGLPGSSYYRHEHQKMGNNYLRFCFNKQYEHLLKAAQRLENINATLTKS